MKLSIIGSRTIDDVDYINVIIKHTIEIYQISKIVSGGAKGPDTIGIQYAQNNNIPYEIFYPDWNLYGKSAGFIRNQNIIDNADVILVFYDGKSKSTLDSILKSFKSDMLKILIIHKMPMI